MRCNGAVMITGNSGGANERQLTIAAGTWPTWAARGRVSISNATYAVENRVSTTILTLRPDQNPGADVAAGTAYNLYQQAYTLPVNFRRLLRLFHASQNREIRVVSMSELFAHDRTELQPMSVRVDNGMM